MNNVNLGQLIITGIKGPRLSKDERNFIQKENIGGVLLFSHNFEDLPQLAHLINSLQMLQKEYPLFIAVDNEGGRVFRFRKFFSQIPSALQLARLNSPEIIYKIAQIQAQEYSACGINLNLAPVCDIWSNPENKVIGDRAYGKEVMAVCRLIPSVIQGLQAHGVMACAKHFPGHGETLEDSHFDLPVVKKSLQELESKEFLPFRKAIESQVEFIMTAHLEVPALDSQWPTSLSPKVHQILRKDLKFTKLILTDDLEMKAISDRYSVGKAALQAITAGADMIEYRSMEYAEKALNALKGLKDKKKIEALSLEEHFLKIKNCKKAYLSNLRPVCVPELDQEVNSKESQSFFQEIHAQLDSLPSETS